MAADRRLRPNEYQTVQQAATSVDECPFCPGHESRTPAEVAVVGRDPGQAANGPGWRIRAFPNKYPAVVPAGGPDLQPVEPTSDDDLWVERPGHGCHEVIVSSANHDDRLATLSESHMAELLALVSQRMAAMARIGSLAHILPFCNQGAAAGATRSHPHLQIIATSIVPALVLEKLNKMGAYRQARGRCLVCDLLERETAAKVRLVAANDRGVLVTPWASRFPYEMLLAPRAHQSTLTDADPADLQALAGLLSRAMRQLAQAQADPAVNLVFHCAPLASCEATDYGKGELNDGFHWHVEILPRLARLAGFEAGTGFAINSVMPETAAQRLRGEDS